MADFNKIYTTSSLTVIPASFASLGFNDNKLISKNKYSINNNYSFNNRYGNNIS